MRPTRVGGIHRTTCFAHSPRIYLERPARRVNHASPRLSVADAGPLRSCTRPRRSSCYQDGKRPLSDGLEARERSLYRRGRGTFIHLNLIIGILAQIVHRGDSISLARIDALCDGILEFLICTGERLGILSCVRKIFFFLCRRR